MGLGLHIANEMMHAMNGVMLFLDENEVDFPEDVRNHGITKAIIALCFCKNKTK